MTPTEVDPLFSNDLIGLIKILAIVTFVVLLPIGALVVYFMKRSDGDALVKLREDMNGLGGRVNAHDGYFARIDADVNGLRSTMAESQRDVMTAIQDSSRAQIEAVHKVELQVARLQERNDLGEALTQFGRSIERLIESGKTARGD